MFKQLPDKFSYPVLEKEILDFWTRENIFERTLTKRKGSKNYNFYEGPPTVNGRPGIHHVMARTVKDVLCRYKTMQGYYVRRQAGWDTHGLPVEIQVEKELGLKDKSEVENFGLAKFNEACREFVYRNIDQEEGWKTLTERMGYWVNMDDPYITCTNDYIESVWWALDQYFKKGLIYRGFKVVPQSPTIETPLSSHELSLGYKEVRDPNCYIKLKVKSDNGPLAGAELMVWTTTPWTLFSNVALAVGPDIDYCVVINTRKLKNQAPEEMKLVIAESRLNVLDGEYEILSKIKGQDIIGTEYEQIFNYLDLKKSEYPNALTVVSADFVTTSDGTGIVHIAPAFGEDDYQMSKKYNLPFVQPVTPNGHLTEELGEFAGRAIKTFKYDDHVEEGVDKDVIIALKVANKIYKSSNDYLHNYPHCWRTGNPIMYYARESWFISSSDYKQEMLDANDKINWQPKEIGTGRFGNWLEEVKDWNLSRDRYWGTPLPLWVNENDKEDIISIGSVEELKKGFYVSEDGSEQLFADALAEQKVELDLHRQVVDNIIFKIDGKIYRRIHEVIDVWFDSGSMPFAQMHYPFENKELFEQSFPADFIAEGIDQTRGWFYTLHNIGTALFGTPAFKNIIVNELILDKTGVKMSKRLGNTVDPFEVMDNLGADAVRWYMIVNNPPWKTTLFNTEEIAKTVISDFFRSLTNTYNFFAMYAEIDGITGQEEKIAFTDRPEIDRWILSKTNSLIREFSSQMDSYEITKAHRAIQDFAVNDLSNWYIRRNRRRFWKGQIDEDKLSAYQTLHEVLLVLVKLMSSTAPFLSEYLYQRLKNDSDDFSVHAANLPVYNAENHDEVLEARMNLAQRIVFLTRSLREKSEIKTRQPLRRVLVPVGSPQERRDIESIAAIVKEEVNIKSIEFLSETTADIVKRKAKPIFPVLGKIFGKDTNRIANLIKDLSSVQIDQLGQEQRLILTVGNEEIELKPEYMDIYSEDIEGWLVSTDRDITVALDTSLSPELISEGIARELVSKVQSARKEKGFEIVDRVTLDLNGSDDLLRKLTGQEDYVKNEILAKDIRNTDDNDLPFTVDTDYGQIAFDVKKIS